MPDSVARMPLDLAVLGQDPRFGGGALAQTNAFLEARGGARPEPTLLYDPHPRLQLATRELVALVDHDDALHSDALLLETVLS